MKGKRGRPRTEKVYRETNVRCDPALLDRVKALSDKTGISQNQLMINFIEIGLDLAECPAGSAAFRFRAWADEWRAIFYEPFAKKTA